ncbi:MAG TPA: hypothetical protein VJT84_05535 [Gaiellaceae bacterium]|nr:hypothetical protein [Gaiellaceae bacterium]
MRIVHQSIEHLDPGIALAERPANLDGKVIGFFDGWGQKNDDGSYGMYPLMSAIKSALEQRYDLAGVHWARKPNVCQPVPRGMVMDFAARVDVVVNGQCI